VSPGGVQEYAQVMRPRYESAARKERSALLDEFCQVTGYHRKAAIRLLRTTVAAERRPRRGRPVTYSVAVISALEQVWETSDRLCSKRLVGLLPDLLEALERHGELQLEPAVGAALKRMSPATIDRRLAAKRRSLARRPFTHTRSAAALQALVPLRTFGEWANPIPGGCQADLVAHCGDTTQGFYLTTLMLVDVATGWQDFDVVWGKGYLHVRGALEFAEKRLPMALCALHTDNGGEFLNYPLQEWCRAKGIRTSRGRPYRKNDQAFVEQRNGNVVRRWVGYDRYSSKPAFTLLHQLYAALRLFVNFFQPLQKLVHKRREGAKVHKTYDVPRTPYQRLLAWDALSPDQQARLKVQYQALNPAALRREIDGCLDALLKHIDRTERPFGNSISEATSAAR
jgi:transposase InsO family protein